MTVTVEDMKKEEEQVMAERDELQKLINTNNKTKAKIVKEKKEPVEKVDEVDPADMVDWVEGVFIFRDQPGMILSFIYNNQRVAIKDGEIAEIPLEISDHLNSLKAVEHEWVHDGKDSAVGEQGVKSVKNVLPRAEFRVTRNFKQHKSVKMKKPERHKM